jgi:hypothetical protein
VTVKPAMVSVPPRLRGRFAATLKVTTPSPLPLLPLVMVIQGA